ncbi:Rne/Rng family ribonuclease [Urechidicola croceus]|uniref:Ribonuclease E/G n=1 Tax=Urechidicola croceus TaxID=1850246 RepID=A0A1D8P8G9_9FLAO|nr:ribonuclease E/G [Urechidicola croceus]AOW20856.1 ribonuclease E/G [Urechidicola croceus]
MKTELIIRSGSSDIDFALLKDGKLIELNKETNDNKISVGDIFLSKIGKTLSGLNAAFVNVGYQKDGFLHYHDLGAQLLSLSKFIKGINTGKQRDFTLKNFHFENDIDKNGKINDVLKTGQDLLVQIVKEPISTKGPRLNSELSIAGRYLVLVPFSNRISVSQKIGDNKEKERLKRLIKSIKPKNFGVIIRTVAQDKKVADLDRDLQNSLERWVAMCKQIKRAQAPTKVLSELNRASSILRDVFNDSFTNIVTDDETLSVEIKDYLQEIAPEKESIVKLHKSSIPIFEKYGIERQIKTSFGQTVSMSKGAYLVIEHTEALHVIDVNSGNRSNKAKSQADTALEVNLIAASEVARQLQLRDMGGIIVVDFIDMHTSEDRQKLFDHLKREMAFDRTKHKILPPSRFGLVQITRQRVRPEMVIKTMEPNPNKDGEVEAPIVLIEKMENELDKLFSSENKYKKIVLNVHPFIASYLKQGYPSIQVRWFLKYKKWIKILPRDAYQYLHYHFDKQQIDKKIS